MLDVVEAIEGESPFEECFMKHCDCGGTPENCCIYRQWREATRKLKESLGQTYLADVAWTHPEHYFSPPPESQKGTLIPYVLTRVYK